MKTKIKIYTSFVSPVSMEIFSKNNLLPIFIIRKIGNSELIGMYEGTSIHFKDLSPSNELFRQKRDGAISFEDFSKRYLIELSERIDLSEVKRKLENLVNISGASGVVLLGYGSDEKACHRSVLSGMLNSAEFSEEKIKELIF